MRLAMFILFSCLFLFFFYFFFTLCSLSLSLNNKIIYHGSPQLSRRSLECSTVMYERITIINMMEDEDEKVR